MSLILQNIILGISLAAPIGPANVAIIKRGLRSGFVAGFLVGIGVVTADTLYLLLIYFGLSHFLDVFWLKMIIWLFGSIVLLYLGFQSMSECFHKISLSHLRSTSRNAFIEGFLINLSNPMTIVWWAGVFGSALTASFDASISRFQALLNSMTIIIGLFAWVFTVALLTHWGKRFLNENSMRYISLIAGILLIGFGLKFGYDAVSSSI